MYVDYIPTVVQAVAGEERNAYAYFSDGSVRRFDCAPLIASGGLFSKLEDESFFRQRLTVLNNTVAWDVSGCYDPTICIDIDPFTVCEGQIIADPLENAG